VLEFVPTFWWNQEVWRIIAEQEQEAASQDMRTV
jgi:hypothetical protein